MSLASYHLMHLEDYLDKAPESGLTEDIVFTKYANFKTVFRCSL